MRPAGRTQLHRGRGPREPGHERREEGRSPQAAASRWAATEGANGELGWYLVSDGSGRPYKVHVRAPGFQILAAVNKIMEGRMLADLIPTFDTINMIGGEVEQ